ncbi:MAG: hypothetical protein COW00_14765 [Bdellovibrio sp. CG12_big_fil_rev_8_21_14_0_65_39_13]|nr:MAG: hypothetical protein COW78_13985 [Bdellovibrio sp. CG22_combo_CG10-13_8_21_14_all_39_27]PIQ58557.1 MAG: hypothetical protein COW00_14765 [Bdellovibrio sp. CG12_big_fil_rev_8_21_14_0_65_39_13]PIR32460.1 MAG: hypothetical protein COV37_19840 [Bdellovibrio sp. CG11_big_fil_rev_8_21_14_0_20_39_38]
MENDIFKEIQSARGKVANIHRVFENLPPMVEGHFYFYKKIMLDQDLPLSRQMREYLAVWTSQANECSYCIKHHQAALKLHYADHLDENKMEFFQSLVKTITIEPHKASLFKYKALEYGISAAEYSHAVAIIAYFNMANRLVFAMDTELEEDYVKSCH